jgi:hypothetical protein
MLYYSSGGRDMDETDQMQVEYAARLKRCLRSVDKDRRMPSSGLISSQVFLMGMSIFSLLPIMREGQWPPASIWCMFGFQVSMVSMWVSNWFYQRRGARASSMAWSMLPTFEEKKYADKNLMENDLLKICRYMETASNDVMLPLSYIDGWRRKAAMAGGVFSLVLLSMAAFCPEEHLLAATSCLVFGFFGFKSLYIILREASWISL